MKTEIVKIKGDWQDVVDACRATVAKPPLGHEPSGEFKNAILISEHSPIREIIVKWSWAKIKSWVATHWSRHKWECYIQTQRTDRTGINRDELPQSAEVMFNGSANIQHLIDTYRKRLCKGQVAQETREYAEDFKATLKRVEAEISDVLVPNCIYRCGCPELNPCDHWAKFYAWAKALHNVDVRTLPIKERYAYYNEYFYSEVYDGDE